MSQLCSQHNNRVERICLDSSCKNRLMCLLCEHDHGGFQSIFSKSSQSYTRFKNIINEEIDLYLLETQNSADAKANKYQIQCIQEYYSELKKHVCQFLSNMQGKNLKFLGGQNLNFIQHLKKIRVMGNFAQADTQMFNIFLRVYDGERFSQFFKGKSLNKSQQAYMMMSDLNKKLRKIMEESSFKLKLTPPQIRVLNAKIEETFKQASYDKQIEIKQNFELNLKFQSNVEFGSVISDCIALKNHIITSSYDKNLRIFDKQLNLLAQLEHQNIITKVKHLQDDVYLIGQSKLLLVQKFGIDTQWEKKQLIALRGHSERINDIGVFNSRIVGSSSDEGVKIWDLYTQKCQYTFKENSNPTCFNFFQQKSVAVGLNDHNIQAYSLQKVKKIKKWALDGVPLYISQQKQNNNIFYVSSLPSNFYIIDSRLNKFNLNKAFKSEGITCFTESIYQQNTIIMGQRGNIGRIFDLRKLQTRYEWICHQGKTNLLKPNGIVKIIEQNENLFLTAGANDKKLKIWQMNKQI